MTNSRLGMADLNKVLFGFDRFMKNTALFQENFDGTYPRFNILSNTESGNKRIEIAVPGWNKADIEIFLHEGVLTVEGKKKLDTKEESETYAKNLKMSYYDTSAKTGLNVNEIFMDLAKKLKQQADLEEGNGD